MKVLLCTLFLLLNAIAFTQTSPSAGNIFIITTDGFRWQEVYGGADSMLICNPAFVKDTSLIKEQYWDADIAARRCKLLPFFWNVIAQNGQLSGNCTYDNNVNVANFIITTDHEAKGELQEKDQTYEKQIAATVSVLLGEYFTANHPASQPIQLPATITTINKTAIASATADK